MQIYNSASYYEAEKLDFIAELGMFRMQNQSVIIDQTSSPWVLLLSLLKLFRPKTSAGSVHPNDELLQKLQLHINHALQNVEGSEPVKAQPQLAGAVEDRSGLVLADDGGDDQRINHQI